MKVFVSWSGAIAKVVGEGLHDLLPQILPGCEPWMSAARIDAGENWVDAIIQELDQADLGVLCLASGRINSPWLLFEAGALSASKAHGRVIPYLINLHPRELSGPLFHLQSVTANREGTKKLVAKLARIGEVDPRLCTSEEVFEPWWREMEERIELARGINDPENLDLTGAWKYTCSVASPPFGQWGGSCSIAKVQGLYDSSWTLKGSREWTRERTRRGKDKLETLVTPLSWETDWFMVIDNKTVKFTYQITTAKGTIRGFSTGDVITDGGRPTRFTGTFHQLAPVMPVFGNMDFVRADARDCA